MIISKGRGYVYGIEYHIVFCTKYRKKILTDSVKDSLFEIIILLSQEMDFKIKSHIYMHVPKVVYNDCTDQSCIKCKEYLVKIKEKYGI